MPARDIIVLGTSLGGLQALERLVCQFAADFPAAVLVVRHLPPEAPGWLPEVLSRAGPLPVSHPRDGDPMEPGHIYVAPPDFHMMVNGDQIHLSRGPRENRFRPSIDVLFRSAARTYGPRVIAVMLTGALYDGVAGMLAVRGSGGVAVVQSPGDATEPALPRTAIQIAGADYIVPVEEMGALLERLVHETVPEKGGKAMLNQADPKTETMIEKDKEAQEHDGRRGKVSVLTCPECGGVMWQEDIPALAHFQCHTGHSFIAEQLLLEQAEELEAALWTAVRLFREKAMLARQLGTKAQHRGDGAAAQRYDEQAHQADQYATLILEKVLHAPTSPAPLVGESVEKPPETRQAGEGNGQPAERRPRVPSVTKPGRGRTG